MVLALVLTSLTGCGQKNPGSASGSGGGSSSSSGDSSTVEPVDLSQVTDPWLTTAGISGDTVVAQVG